jgi:hypothetical protein
MPEAAKSTPESPAQPQAVHGEATVRSHPTTTQANPTLDLLEKAHAHLLDRNGSIEAELARQTDLTNELDTINTQIRALDKTLGVFKA